jgi:putative ABC transport system permease protein
MIKDYFSLGIKNLKRRGIRSWLTLLGILIGIAAVVSLITLGQGLQAAVNSQFGISSTEVISVQAGGVNAFGPPGSGAVNPLTVQDVEAIAKLDTVEIAVGRNIRTIKTEFRDEVIFGMGVSITDGEGRDFLYEAIDLEMEAGRFLKDGDTKKVMLGYNYYKDRGVFEKSVRPGNTILLQDKEFDVVGITAKKGSFLLDNVIYVNDAPLEDLIGYGDEVDIIGVKVKNKDLMEKAKLDIERILRQRRDVDKGEEDFTVETPEASLETVNQVLGGIQAFIIIIASASIIVGAIGIVNTMTTSVMERRKEIGIMKAVGARNRDIFLQFFIEAGLLGLIGGLVGIIIGISIGVFGTVAINNFIGATTKPQADLWLIFGALIGSFVIGSISGITPAMQAAKQHPVDALRG